MTRWYENRVFRLLATVFLLNGIVVAIELLTIVGLIACSFDRQTLPPMWAQMLGHATSSGTIAGQILMLSLVAGLYNKARWRVWVAVLPLVVLLSIGVVAAYFGPELYVAIWLRNYDQLRVVSMMVVVGSSLPVVLCFCCLLLASVVLWPVKIFAGWSVAWHDEPVATVRSAPIFHLMMWVGLWAALFLLATRLSEHVGGDGIILGLVGFALILITGLPVTFLMTGRKVTLLRWGLALAHVLLLSWGESELIYWVLKPPGFTTVGRVLVVVLGFNAPLAGIVAMNCQLLRALGLWLHMPIWRQQRKVSTSSDFVCPTADS